MKLDFKKLKKKELENITYGEYEHVIIGSGPSATVLLNELLKKNKKILIIEKGNFIEKKYESVNSINIKIKKNSRTFTIGGTGQEWSNISSYFENFELKNRNNKRNSWPLTHSDLLKLYKKIDKKFGFDYQQLRKIDLNIPFSVRKFFARAKPTNFKKFHLGKNYDILYNATVDYIDENLNSVIIYIASNSKKKIIKVKSVTLCNGGLETIKIILKSLKKGMLKRLENKKFVGKYFMDHPKTYIGILNYPKKKFIDKIKLDISKNKISYYGISLSEEDQIKNNCLNSYVRFEKQDQKLSSVLDLLDKTLGLNFKKKESYLMRIFLEMKPRFNNKIKINKNENIVSNFDIGAQEVKTIHFLVKKIYNYLSKEPNKEKINLLKKSQLKLDGASHHMGGLSFPLVVDKNLKFNGLNNIYCCSSSIFPTSGSANPTMTICALAIKHANYLLKRKI